MKWEQLTIWFSFYFASSKTSVSPIGRWEKKPKQNIQYIYKNKMQHINIDLYTYFLLWLNPRNAPKAFTM